MINRNRRRPPSRRGGAYWSHTLTGLALFSGLLVSGCGSTAQIPSSWRTRGVTVDSAAREWKSAFTPIKDYTNYDTREHHTNVDFYERVDEASLTQSAIVMAVFAYHAAMRDQKFPRMPVPARGGGR